MYRNITTIYWKQKFWKTEWPLQIVNFIFDLCRVGLDLYQGTVRDNKKAGVLEPAMSKIKSLKFATEAAITILRIDDMIKLVDQERGRGKTYQDALNAGEL